VFDARYELAGREVGADCWASLQYLEGVFVSVAATLVAGQNSGLGKGFLLHKNQILEHFIKIKFLWIQRGLLKESNGDIVCKTDNLGKIHL